MNTKNIVTWAVLLAFLITPLVFLGFFDQEALVPEPGIPVMTPSSRHAVAATLMIRDVPFSVEVADTPARQAQGLSGRPTLGEREGLLFVFPQAGVYNFWMKDMLFPIDIIWIGEDRRVVDLTEDARPESYPKTFASRVPARYVLEVPAGTVRRENFVIGDPVAGTLLGGL